MSAGAQTLTSDNSNQQKRLGSLDLLIAEKIAFMQKEIKLRKNIDFKAARDLMLHGQGKQIMDDIRQLITEMRSEESGLLQRRLQAESVGLQNVVLTLITGALLSFLFLLSSFYFVNREANKRNSAEKALRCLNNELDERVQQQTAELITAKKWSDKQLNQLKTLRMIDSAILGITDSQLVFKTILEETRNQLQADAAVFMLFNPHTFTINVAASIGLRTQIAQRWEGPVGEGRGISSRSILERRVIAVPRFSEEMVPVDMRPIMSAEEVKTMYAVPLIAKGQVLGVLDIVFRTPFDADQDWLDFLETFAGQVAIAIDNVRSFEDLQRSNFDLALAYNTTIEGWSHALDLRDKETEGHSLRVTKMTLKLAHLAGVSNTELVHIKRGALLHDIGKMGIPDAILLKPDKLTEEEWVIMRKHPVYAYELLSPITYLRPALDIPYFHHEKWDGSGYPNGLKGDQIPLAARLFAIVDTWDALQSDRPYRQRWSEEKTFEYIQAQAGKNFDPKAVKLFLHIFSKEMLVHV